MLVLFWYYPLRTPHQYPPRLLTPLSRAFELADSIFQLRPHKVYRFHLSLVAKATAALLPALQVVLLRFSGVDKSTIGFMTLADAISTPPAPSTIPPRP